MVRAECMWLVGSSQSGVVRDGDSGYVDSGCGEVHTAQSLVEGVRKVHANSSTPIGRKQVIAHSKQCNKRLWRLGLRVFADLSEDLGMVPSTLVRQLTVACSSSSRGLDSLF